MCYSGFITGKSVITLHTPFHTRVLNLSDEEETLVNRSPLENVSLLIGNAREVSIWLIDSLVSDLLKRCTLLSNLV